MGSCHVVPRLARTRSHPLWKRQNYGERAEIMEVPTNLSNCPFVHLSTCPITNTCMRWSCHAGCAEVQRPRPRPRLVLQADLQPHGQSPHPASLASLEATHESFHGPFPLEHARRESAMREHKRFLSCEVYGLACPPRPLQAVVFSSSHARAPLQSSCATPDFTWVALSLPN